MRKCGLIVKTHHHSWERIPSMGQYMYMTKQSVCLKFQTWGYSKFTVLKVADGVQSLLKHKKHVVYILKTEDGVFSWHI